MVTIDMTHRKLNFPPRFLPYLEKHRIFELLHECVELLVQAKPRDHVQFLKRVLPCAAMKRNKQRIVFLSPKGFDRKNFSQLLAECLGIQCFDLQYLRFLTQQRMAEKGGVEEAESAEEESCICPGEASYWPLMGPQEEFGGFPQVDTTVTSVEEEIVEPEEPCPCVCPCVKSEEFRDKADGSDDGKEEEVGRTDGGERKKGSRCPKKDDLDRDRAFEAEESGEGLEEASEAGPIDFEILSECEFSAQGWILQDFPLTGNEATKLNGLGVLPTHVVRIIVDEEDEGKNREYKSVVRDWVRAYERFVPVTEIHVRGRSVVELSEDLCRLLSVMPHRHAPMLPRIVLIGSRGSGVTTQGQKLAQKYNMVHVEFDLVVARALEQDDDLCRLYKMQLATRPDAELEALLLERALLTGACRNRGWVLTGYPNNIDQMRMLDIIATPPNRVIFIEVPARECFVRLYYRKTDPCLGDEYKLPQIEPYEQDSYRTQGIQPEVASRLLPHPRNNKKQIIHDIEQYFLHKADMMYYCGKTASYVDGNQTADAVFELIEQILINPAPPHPPREPLAINHGIGESYERLKKFRLASGMYFNNMVLNPPENVVRL